MLDPVKPRMMILVIVVVLSRTVELGLLGKGTTATRTLKVREPPRLVVSVEASSPIQVTTSATFDITLHRFSQFIHPEPSRLSRPTSSLRSSIEGFRWSSHAV